MDSRGRRGGEASGSCTRACWKRDGRAAGVLRRRGGEASLTYPWVFRLLGFGECGGAGRRGGEASLGLSCLSGVQWDMEGGGAMACRTFVFVLCGEEGV